MGEFWDAYVNFWNWQTTIPIAFIISTAIACMYYVEEEEIGASVCVGLVVLPVAYGLVLLLSLCNGVYFPDWWEKVSMVVGILVAIGCGIAALAAEGGGCLALIGAIIGFYITYFVFFYASKYVIFPLIKYLLGYGIYHGILLLGVPGVVIAAIVMMSREISEYKSLMVLFIYTLFVGVIFLMRPALSTIVKTYIYHAPFFLAPFVIASIILLWKRNIALWILLFVMLFGATLFQMWRFLRIVSEHNTGVKEFFLLHPMLFLLSYPLIVCALGAYYLWRLSKAGEMDANKLHLLWLFFAVLVNSAYPLPFILGYYSSGWIVVFILLNTFVGGGIIFGRQIILQKG